MLKFKCTGGCNVAFKASEVVYIEETYGEGNKGCRVYVKGGPADGVEVKEYLSVIMNRLEGDYASYA